MYAIFLKYCFS